MWAQQINRSQTSDGTYRRPNEHWVGVGSARNTCSMSASTSHTTGATRQEAGSMGMGSVDRSSVSYIRNSASALAFWEPGL